MRHLFVVVFILLSMACLAIAGETEYLLTREEFVEWEKNAKELMQLVVTDYGNALPPKKRAQLMTEQRLWLKKQVAPCSSEKDFESQHECFATAYGTRARDFEEKLVAELKRQNVNFSRPRFPVNISSGEEFRMDALGGGKYSFSFTVFGGNGHVCSGGGIAVPKGYSFSRLPDLLENQEEVYPHATASDMHEINQWNKDCELEITFTPHFVVLQGNYSCHQYFMCGMRASVSGEFQRDDFRLPHRKWGRCECQNP